MAAPDAVVTERVITGASLGTANFANPSDVYVDENGDLYIVDTDNNRIVVLNSELAMVREITSVTDGEDVLTFQKPQGIYIWQSTLYVADTGNARIVAFDKDGRVTRIIGAPESGSLPEDFQFKPTKRFWTRPAASSSPRPDSIWVSLNWTRRETLRDASAPTG